MAMEILVERTLRRLTQHKSFVPYGTHQNSSLTLRTSFMLGTLYEMAEKNDIPKGRRKP